MMDQGVVDLSDLDESHPQKCNGFDVDHATCYRNFRCKKYDYCLNHAIKNQWRSFSCKCCQKYFDNNESLDCEEKLEFYIIKYFMRSTDILSSKYKN
jgi:hypothetical protein